MVAKKTNKKEARKQLVAKQFGAETVFSREALYNIVKNNSLFKGTKDNKQLVTNALVALVGEGVLQRNGSKKFSTYCLSEDRRNELLKSDRIKSIKEKMTSSPKQRKENSRPYDEYLPPQRAAKPIVQKGLLTGLTSLSVQMIMLQKKIEDTLLSKADNPKEAAELISEYVLVAAQMMQPQ